MFTKGGGGGVLPIALFLVVLSGLIHAIWNLFTKKSLNKVVFLWFCQWTAIIVFLPLTIRELATWGHPLRAIGLILLFISAICHGFYVLLLAKAYSIGDLSQVYPIMRGTSPVLVPLIGVLILGEHLYLANWIGVALIVIGIFIIGGFQFTKVPNFSNRAGSLAFCVGLMITGYTVIDKMTLPYIPPVVLNEVSNIGNLLALSWGALRSKAINKEWQTNWKTIILGGLLAPGGYILFLKALQFMPVAQIAPMREIGTVFGTLFGVFILREAQGKKRIGASAIIVLGVILLS